MGRLKKRRASSEVAPNSDANTGSPTQPSPATRRELASRYVMTANSLPDSFKVVQCASDCPHDHEYTPDHEYD